jgi:ABC-type spermidine/putrescine transport system permease subunit II
VVVASGNGIMNGVLLASAVVPVLIVGVLCWVFFRAARRNDERERCARQ